MQVHKSNLLLRCAPLAIAMALAGCTVDERMTEANYQPNSGSEQYPITVGKGTASMQVASRSGGLDPAQINSVAAFARQASASGLTPVTVSRPSAGGNSSRTAYEVANLLAQQGVPPRLIKVRTYHGSSSAPVRVSYASYGAKVRPCGDWSVDATNSRMNELGVNHGCAVQSNIAAMVANPNDFLRPQPSTPALGSTRVDAVDAIDGNSVSLDPIQTTASSAAQGSSAAPSN